MADDETQQFYYVDDPNLVDAPGYFSQQQLTGFGYNRYNIRQHFLSATGLFQLPTAGPVGTPARIVRLHAPTSMKIITWVVEMECEIGQKPVLPHWDTGDVNEVFVKGEVEVDSPNIRANGQIFHWRAKGEYHYVSALAGREAITGGAAPSISLPPAAFDLNYGDFSRDFLRAATSGLNAFNGIVFDDKLI